MAHELVTQYEERRKASGIPSQRVLRRAGVSAATVWRWLQPDGSSPIIKTIERLERALDEEIAARNDLPFHKRR